MYTLEYSVRVKPSRTTYEYMYNTLVCIEYIKSIAQRARRQVFHVHISRPWMFARSRCRRRSRPPRDTKHGTRSVRIAALMNTNESLKSVIVMIFSRHTNTNASAPGDWNTAHSVAGRKTVRKTFRYTDCRAKLAYTIITFAGYYVYFNMQNMYLCVQIYSSNT